MDIDYKPDEFDSFLAALDADNPAISEIIRSMAQDSRRYRRLRDDPRIADNRTPSFKVLMLLDRENCNQIQGSDLDFCIDSAEEMELMIASGITMSAEVEEPGYPIFGPDEIIASREIDTKSR